MKIPIDFSVYTSRLLFKDENNKRFIFDLIRKKYLVFEPEEMIRQLVLIYLIEELRYNGTRISVERGLKVITHDKRCDILVYDRAVKPWLLVECKSHNVKVDYPVFSQIARYNLTLKVKYLMVTNGTDTYCCRIDYQEERFEFLPGIPEYPGRSPSS